MGQEQMPLWQRLIAALIIVLGAIIADPIGHALARPTNVGGPAATFAVPVLLTILLFVALCMALIGPQMVHTPRPLDWVEWLAAVVTGLTFALSGLAVFWIGVEGPEVRSGIGVLLVHVGGWLYVLLWRKYAVKSELAAGSAL